jgi:Glycosyltransferase family 87
MFRARDGARRYRCNGTWPQLIGRAGVNRPGATSVLESLRPLTPEVEILGVPYVTTQSITKSHDAAATSDAPAVRPRGRPRDRRRKARRRRVAIVVLVAVGAMAFAAAVTGLRALGDHVTLPAADIGSAPAGGGIGAAINELVGMNIGTDFLADYASADAMTEDVDPYAPMVDLMTRVGTPWAVAGANTHPPTQLTLVLPFTLLAYQDALSAWCLLMVLAFIATVLLMGVRPALAVPIGLRIALTFPGAYAIGNPVPVIGLGIALAYRYRDRPALAGLGLAVAVAPKASGLLLVAVFLLSGRVKVVTWAAAGVLVAVVTPVLFYPDVWSRYLDAGTASISFNAARDDNGAILHLGERVGLPTWATMALICVLAGVAVLRTRDMFWPSVWVMVASLPVAWMYSVVTLLPLVVTVLLRSRSATLRGVAVLASVLTIASTPLGEWPVVVVPIVVGLGYLLLFGADLVLEVPSCVDRWTSRLGFGRRISQPEPVAA